MNEISGSLWRHRCLGEHSSIASYRERERALAIAGFATEIGLFLLALALRRLVETTHDNFVKSCHDPMCESPRASAIAPDEHFLHT